MTDFDFDWDVPEPAKQPSRFPDNDTLITVAVCLLIVSLLMVAFVVGMELQQLRLEAASCN